MNEAWTTQPRRASLPMKTARRRQRAARKLAEELGAAVLIVAVRNQDPDQVAVER